MHGLTYLMLVTNQDFYTQMLQQEMLAMMQYQLVHIPRSPNFQRSERSAAGRKPLNNNNNDTLERDNLEKLWAIV